MLASAVKSHNDAMVRQILERHGFTAQQLQSATLVLVDHAGAPPPKPNAALKVTIEVSCCPLKIVVTISF